MKILGRVNGYFGSLHLPESGPPEGKAVCVVCEGESTFLPSQQEGKFCVGGGDTVSKHAGTNGNEMGDVRSAT